jgi:hypothetical protein
VVLQGLHPVSPLPLVAGAPPGVVDARRPPVLRVASRSGSMQKRISLLRCITCKVGVQAALVPYPSPGWGEVEV